MEVFCTLLGLRLAQAPSKPLPAVAEGSRKRDNGGVICTVGRTSRNRRRKPIGTAEVSTKQPGYTAGEPSSPWGRWSGIDPIWTTAVTALQEPDFRTNLEQGSRLDAVGLTVVEQTWRLLRQVDAMARSIITIYGRITLDSPPAG